MELKHAVWDRDSRCLRVPRCSDSRWGSEGELLNEAKNDRCYSRLLNASLDEFPPFPSLDPCDLIENADFVLCQTDGMFEPVRNCIEDPTLKYSDDRFIRLPHSTLWRDTWSWKDGHARAFDKVIAIMSTLTGDFSFDDIREVFLELKTIANKAPAGLLGLERLWKECEDNGNIDWLKCGIKQVATLVMQTDQILTSAIPLLHGDIRSVTLSTQQCACLLALAFFGLIPGRDRRAGGLPKFNFDDFLLGDEPIHVEKLKFIINYFFLDRKGCDNNKETTFRSGCVTFYRRSVAKEDLPDWSTSEVLLSCSLLALDKDSSIEDAKNMLQVDFANKFIGGGVLRKGAVQEEIHMMLCPETLVALLLCPVMDAREAIRIIGAAQYNKHEGYKRALRFVSQPMEQTISSLPQRDKYGRGNVELAAMDALRFVGARQKATQYEAVHVNRELDKAFVAFFNPHTERDAKAVATGNWGCGAFGGDPVLKGLLQWMVCAQVNRNMLHHSWGEADAFSMLEKLTITLIRHKVTVGALHGMIVDYGQTPPRERQKHLCTHILRHIENAVGKSRVSQ